MSPVPRRPKSPLKGSCHGRSCTAPPFRRSANPQYVLSRKRRSIIFFQSCVNRNQISATDTPEVAGKLLSRNLKKPMALAWEAGGEGFQHDFTSQKIKYESLIGKMLRQEDIHGQALLHNLFFPGGCVTQIYTIPFLVGFGGSGRCVIVWCGFNMI